MMKRMIGMARGKEIRNLGVNTANSTHGIF